MKLNEQLKILRKALNINQNNMAIKLNIAPSSYQYYERGERTIPSDVVEKIIKNFSVNVEWLFENSGKMFKDEKEFEIENINGYPKWDKVKANIGERIIEAYKLAGKNYDLELLQNWLSQSDLNDIISGTKQPNNMILEGVIRDTGVSKSFLEGYALHPQLKNNQNEDHEFVQVPFFDDIYAAAGQGILAGDEKISRQIAFRHDWLRKMRFNSAHLTLVHFEGNSMTPTLQNGDIILIDYSQTEIRPDRIVVVSADNMVYVKRIQGPSEGKLILKSDNSAEYPPFPVDMTDEKNRIVGRVIWVARCL